jgi:prevent-host-death family protein
MRAITSVEAQSRFEQLLDAAQREPVTITRLGEPDTFLISASDMQELLAIQRKRGQALEGVRWWCAGATASINAKQAAEVATLSDEDVVRLVHELR